MVHAIASAPDAFAMLSADEAGQFVISFASDGFTTVGNRSPAELVDTKLFDLFRLIGPNLDDATIEQFCTQIVEQPRASVEFSSEKAGKTHYYNLRTYRLSGESTPRIFAILFDETEERVRESRLRTQEEEVAKTSKLASLGEMAGGIAHELKSPLNTIQAYVDLINQITSQEDQPREGRAKGHIRSGRLSGKLGCCRVHKLDGRRIGEFCARRGWVG